MDTDLNTDKKASGENKGGQQVYRLESGLNNGKHGCYYTNTQTEKDTDPLFMYMLNKLLLSDTGVYIFSILINSLFNKLAL